MPVYKWQIDLRDYQREHARRSIEREFFKSTKCWKKYWRQCEIDRQKYYEGFNVGREKTMFKEELEDLEQVYITALENYEKEIEEILPSHMYYMERFLVLKKKHEAISEKLEALLQKTGREPQEESDGGDDE